MTIDSILAAATVCAIEFTAAKACSAPVPHNSVTTSRQSANAVTSPTANTIQYQFDKFEIGFGYCYFDDRF